jgi:hypothetical protein
MILREGKRQISVVLKWRGEGFLCVFLNFFSKKKKILS